MSMRKVTKGMSFNATWFYEIDPLRLENIEDIELRHEIENLKHEINIDKLAMDQRKNNLR